MATPSTDSSIRWKSSAGSDGEPYSPTITLTQSLDEIGTKYKKTNLFPDSREELAPSYAGYPVGNTRLKATKMDQDGVIISIVEGALNSPFSLEVTSNNPYNCNEYYEDDAFVFSITNIPPYQTKHFIPLSLPSFQPYNIELREEGRETPIRLKTPFTYSSNEDIFVGRTYWHLNVTKNEDGTRILSAEKELDDFFEGSL